MLDTLIGGDLYPVHQAIRRILSVIPGVSQPLQPWSELGYLQVESLAENLNLELQIELQVWLGVELGQEVHEALGPGAGRLEHFALGGGLQHFGNEGNNVEQLLLTGRPQ